MLLTENIRLRLYCKRRKGDAAPCGGIYETTPKELTTKQFFTPKCPTCEREFSEDRTINLQGELTHVFARLLTVASSWPFNIEILPPSNP